ncbi:uncharacterized protein LOC114533199 [Dendronephthya gigantea]|uniref:uncharacterized protein LOC114533199 n=1 Tax=Dendronephthya gigantea TaxID=151771 RepID=UPI00106C4DDF|nr:uncharacterized protein LOC114533199 [Dendronephthya gigantea]
MADENEQLWKMALEEAKTQFEIDNFMEEQKEAIKAFFQNKNVLVNLPTGFGKSLIYQCLTIVGDVLHKKPRGSSVIVVISPLRSLMNDQVAYLQSVGVPAIAITDEEDPETVEQVMNGIYIVIYGSPECLLSMSTWRGIFQCESFRKMLIGVAIDEAHCIVQW